MTEEKSPQRLAAEAEAEKRERHKSKHMANKRWQAVHDPVKGWHAALVDCPLYLEREAQRAREKATAALRQGANFGTILDLASDALMARVKAELAHIPADPETGPASPTR